MIQVRNQCTVNGRVAWVSKLAEIKDRYNRMVTLCRYQLDVPRTGWSGYDRIICVAFDRKAWYAFQNLKKGTWVTVTGHLHTDEFRVWEMTIAVHSQKILKREEETL